MHGWTSAFVQAGLILRLHHVGLPWSPCLRAPEPALNTLHASVLSRKLQNWCTSFWAHLATTFHFNALRIVGVAHPR